MLDPDGRPVFKRPMWLVVVDKRRYQLSLLEVHQTYTQRYHLGHFFRLCKQRLLLARYQTPDVEHEESGITSSNWPMYCCGSPAA